MSPYIKGNRRREAIVPEDWSNYSPGDAGELNYFITTKCQDYLNKRETNYSTLNEIIGVLECVKQEFYRRVVASYENKKIKENGDIYTPNNENEKIYFCNNCVNILPKNGYCLNCFKQHVPH